MRRAISREAPSISCWCKFFAARLLRRARTNHNALLADVGLAGFDERKAVGWC